LVNHYICCSFLSFQKKPLGFCSKTPLEFWKDNLWFYQYQKTPKGFFGGAAEGRPSPCFFGRKEGRKEGLAQAEGLGYRQQSCLVQQAKLPGPKGKAAWSKRQIWKTKPFKLRK